MCRGTTLGPDDDTVKELRKLREREVGESISGRIKTNQYEGVPGISIEVKGNDKTFKTITNKDGNFSISLPTTGPYEVRVTVPYAVELVSRSNDEHYVRKNETASGSIYEYDVTLKKSECSYLELDLDGRDPRATATVTGNVRTPTGEAAEKSAVYLVNELDTGPDYIELLKNDGSFRFQRVAPGEYYLVLTRRTGSTLLMRVLTIPRPRTSEKQKRFRSLKELRLKTWKYALGPD